MTISQEKTILRQEIILRIRKLSEHYINNSNRNILEALLSLPEFISANRIFTYLSVGREVDTIELIHRCLAFGKTVALPCDVNSGNMRFARLDTSIEELSPGSYGIPCPSPNAETLIPTRGDLIIVPCLCCDEEFFRLGHGGGYYDRVLSFSQGISLCLCREELICKRLPRETHDIPMDLVLTDNKLRGH